MQTFDLAEAASWLDLPASLPRLKVRSVVTDSRQVQRGDLFISLKGERVDGHSFLEQVAKKGAIAALVSFDYHGPDFGLELIKVADVITALQQMARRRLAELSCKIIAVTGSVGKTTTKDFIATLLSSRFHVAKSPGNANSQVGVPTTILNIQGDEEILILEMGMTEAGEIARLITIAPPKIAVITKIGHSHIKYFSNGIEGIAAAKAEIFSHPKTTLGVANAQTKRFDAVLNTGSCKKIFVGSGGEVEFTANGSCVLLANGMGQSFSVDLPFQATHLIENFSLAATVAILLGVTHEEIALKAKELSTYKNRFELVEKNGISFLNDSYNASPESMRAALDNLPPYRGKAIAVFGEMKDLGVCAESAHREVATHALDKVDHMLCFGAGCSPMVEIFQKAGKPVEMFRDFIELKKRVYSLAEQGDLVLLKGSNANNLWKVLEEEEEFA